MTQPIDSEFRQEAYEEFERVGKLLETLDTDPVSRITLQEFEMFALPLLSKWGPEFPIRDWLIYAEHPYIRFEVIDLDGNVKYIIPSFLARQPTLNRAPAKLSAFANDYSALQAASPIGANGALRKYLTACTDTGYDATKDADEVATHLNKIFKDYNLPLIPLLGEASETSIVETAPVKEVYYDDNDYDDF